MSYKTKADILASIFSYYDVNFKTLGTKALYTINDKTIAEVQFNHGHNNYHSLIVTIQNKEHGEIASNTFSFEQYLTREPCSNPHSKTIKNMYIWDDNGLDWYIVRPKNTKPIVDAIIKYIEIYT